MIGLFDRLSRPFLRALDPEDAHALTVKALRYVPLAKSPPDAAELHVQAFGLNFPNPVGLAAGFDKNGQVPDALMRLGFGFVEVGTVTPRAPDCSTTSPKANVRTAYPAAAVNGDALRWPRRAGAHS